MITQVTSMFVFSEKWGDNEVESQNVKGNYHKWDLILNCKMYF